MKRNLLITLLLLCASFTATAETKRQARARAEVLSRSRGYYKEVFMDGGIALTSRHSLSAAKFLGIEMEYFASAAKDKVTQKDTLLQTNIFCGYKQDTNGWLLYPDGAPRFRMIYVNGGKSGSHARSLGEEGRARVQQYVSNGGGYLGTCAGAYIATCGSLRTTGVRNGDSYWHLWPGYARPTRLLKSRPTLILTKKSPLLHYFDFGKDRTIEEVYHNGGCSAYESSSIKLPEGTERLAQYIFDDTEKVQIDGKISVWSYKANEQSGRIVMCGSHPEGIGSGERLKFMSAMMLYAMDGNAAPTTKGALKEGDVREMNKRTEDNDPAFTRIGDRQYHHFEIEVPRKCKKAIIKIDGYEGEKRFDLSLCAKRGELAFHDNTTLKSVSRGVKKRLTIENPKPGRWFVSVFCETTVTSAIGKYGTYYRGRISVLNGVPYKISVEYE